MIAPHNSFRLMWKGRAYSSHEDLKNLLEEDPSHSSQWEIDVLDFLSDWMDDSEYIELNTSGSTGTPKPIRLSKKTMIQSAQMTAKFLALQSGNSALLCLPARYIAGMMMIVRAYCNGWELYCMEPRSIPSLFFHVDFAAMTPMQIHHLLTDAKQSIPIQTLILGGGVIPPQLEKLLLTLRNIHIFHTYGMTETASHIAMRKIGESYFQALPGIQFYKDERSCLIVHAPMLELPPLYTNDIVELLNSQQFIWKGRIDNVINSGGIKLYPEQIEHKLQPLIKRPFFVMGVPDERLGEKCVLILEGMMDEPDILELNASMRAILSRYEMVKSCHFIPKFVRTLTGKISRKETAKLLEK